MDYDIEAAVKVNLDVFHNKCIGRGCEEYFKSFVILSRVRERQRHCNPGLLGLKLAWKR